MNERVELCRDQHARRLRSINWDIFVECQREKGHEGVHAAVWVGGLLEWSYVEQETSA